MSSQNRGLAEERDWGWGHRASDPSRSCLVFRHFQDDWWNSGMIVCTWLTLLLPLYSCCFEFMVKDGADQVYQQNYKSWGIKQRTDKKLHCCIFSANRWRTILLVLLLLIFLVKAIAGNTNNSSTEEGITKQYRDEEPRCIHFSTAIKYIRVYIILVEEDKLFML